MRLLCSENYLKQCHQTKYVVFRTQITVENSADSKRMKKLQKKNFDKPWSREHAFAGSLSSMAENSLSCPLCWQNPLWISLCACVKTQWKSAPQFRSHLWYLHLHLFLWWTAAVQIPCLQLRMGSDEEQPQRRRAWVWFSVYRQIATAEWHEMSLPSKCCGHELVIQGNFFICGNSCSGACPDETVTDRNCCWQQGNVQHVRSSLSAAMFTTGIFTKNSNVLTSDKLLYYRWSMRTCVGVRHTFFSILVFSVSRMSFFSTVSRNCKSFLWWIEQLLCSFYSHLNHKIHQWILRGDNMWIDDLICWNCWHQWWPKSCDPCRSATDVDHNMLFQFPVVDDFWKKKTSFGDSW